ncbi:MAG: hypothetical protein K2G78_03060, partial [Muribaculaceae bacterium]|nr:hypothetical protein [Muribaculaceae bacterium]
YYNGEQMAGKSAMVKVASGEATMTFDSSFDLSMLTGMGLAGELPAPGVTPGDAVITLTSAAREGDGSYDVAGSADTDYVTFNYAGSIGADKMTFAITDARLKNQVLAGNVFAPAPIVKQGVADYTSLPFHLVWELDPAAGIDLPLSEVLKVLATAPVIPVYEGTAYTSVAQAFVSLVKTIALTESGNVPVMYVSTLGGAAHIATTCGNMMQYVPTQSGLRLYLNPLQVVSEALLALSDNKDDAKFDFATLLKKSPAGRAAATAGDGAEGATDPALTRAMIGVLLKALAPQIAGGVPLTVEPTAAGADIYFDTATSVTFLATLLQEAMKSPEIMAAVQQALGGVEIPGVRSEQLAGILQQLPQYLIKTTKLEIGLQLVKVPAADQSKSAL